jgi:general secretion pathway protein G
MNTRHTQRGFSLIEIMVVLAILAIVAGTAVPLVGKNVTRGKIAETRAELAAFPTAVSGYFEDTGTLPPTFDDLQQNLAAAAGWAGPYLLAMLSASASTTTSLEQDAWSRDYTVSITGASSLTVTSKGPDGATGGGDDISQAVDVTPVRRAQTLAELKTINIAISAYNALNLPSSPLPSDYASIKSTLVSGGYLPGSTSAYDTDGWGSAYAPDPPGGSPVVAVASPNL